MPQGTIKAFDVERQNGVLLDDSKNEIPFDSESFRLSGVRMFRIGQRVKFSLVGETPKQSVRDLTIVTL